MFQPLDDRVLIEPLKPGDVSPGGIIIPDPHKERPNIGAIVAVGPGKQCAELGGERMPMTLKIGDVVAYPANVGKEVEIDGRPHLVIKEGDVLGVLDG